MSVLAITEWPEAIVAVAGIAFITIVISVLVWQIFATGRSGITSHREAEYKKLVEELTTVQRETTGELQRANEAIAQLREQTHQLGQALEEVDRVLKAVE